jgi:hypothetical protein
VPYLVATGGIDEAAQVAERALAMARRLHEGTHNPELVDLARHAQVVVLRAQGQLAPALALAREVLASRQGHLPPLHSNILATRSLVAELLRETGEPDLATAELVAALDSWRQRPIVYTLELDRAMKNFAEAGLCDWLAGPWPADGTPVMAQALERDRRACS